MKKCIYILLSFICVFITGCQEKKTYRIGVSQCSSDDWRNKCNDEINRELMFHPEATVEIRSAEDSNEKQKEDIRYFMRNHFDIIICSPNEADEITPVVREAYEAGFPVIIFDRDIHGESYTAYIGADNFGIGESAARYAYNLTGKNAKVIEIYGLPGSTPAIERHNGFVKEAARCGLQLIATEYGNWTYEDAAAVCDSLFQAHNDVDLVFAHNDRMAIAASDVARRHGMEIKVIGIDAAPEIGMKAVADSVIDATFLYPTEGYRLVRTALAILKGEPYERRTVLPKSPVVNLSNADILLLQNETLKDETNKIEVLKGEVDEYWSQHSAQTMLFYITIAFLCLLFVVLFLLLHAFWQKRQYQNDLQERNRLLEAQRDTEKALNEQLRVATQSKLMFFTNVSHDLRTPLTLIAESVEQFGAAEDLSPRQQTLLRIANKNILILKRLINQILDFRKFENGKLDAHLQEVHFASLVREWGEAFHATARKRDITLAFNIGVTEDFTLALDPEKMERVFFNLMSNAFKYTPRNGKITFSCSASGSDLVFSVEDTGKGISHEEIGNIFTRFYQVDKIHPQGSGIGLTLAKAFVELHGGSITVESEPNAGATFAVSIPIRHIEEKERGTEGNNVVTALITASDVDKEFDTIEQDNAVIRPDDPLLLVIDDNEDIRRMIALLMEDEYNVISASNGKEGFALATKYVPDIIICDVMMPVMDGMECCRRLKEEISTSHIPVLMLTACSLDEQRAQGYDSGADGYLSKPFSSAVLKSRCRNLIENRKRITNSIPQPLSGKKVDPSGNGTVMDMENKFYARFLEIVNEEMSDSELSVDKLASKMNLGRSQLYRKIKALTNYSPVELLRDIRLKKARGLLLSTDKSISEIAYEVGFSTPAYFTRCYREAFGETPTDRRKI